MTKIDRVHLRHSQYYYDIAQLLRHSPRQVKKDFPQIQAAIAWLLTQNEAQSHQFLKFIRATNQYYYAHSLVRDLMAYCERGIEICLKRAENPGWLYLVRAQAYFSIGEWSRARNDVQSALQISQGVDAITYARSLLELGRLHLNVAAYQSALDTLTRAKELLSELQDLEGVAMAGREIATYFHNHGEHLRALQLCLEIQDLDPVSISKGTFDHNAFMLGVIYRKLKQPLKARDYLLQHLKKGKDDDESSTIATAMHHLAWVHLDLKDIEEAQQLGQQAKKLYDDIGDIRGASDADEQLGVICLMKKDFNAARKYLIQSISTRALLGNRHGVASGLRRLARCCFLEGNWAQGIRYMGQSLSLYVRLGVLSRERLLSILKP